MKRLLMWLVLRQHYDNSYAWLLSKGIYTKAKADGTRLSLKNIVKEL